MKIVVKNRKKTLFEIGAYMVSMEIMLTSEIKRRELERREGREVEKLRSHRGRANLRLIIRYTAHAMGR